MSKREGFKPRSVDKFIISTIGMLHILNGLYLVGPWYLDETESGKAPLVTMFNSNTAVIVYGSLLLIDGLILFFSLNKKLCSTRIVSNALLAGFLLRLYALIGVFLTIDSWRPPSYLSHITTVLITGAMWVWIKVSERTIQ